VVSADLSVTVNVPPVTTYTLTPSTGTLCPGGSLTLTLSGSDSGVSYQLLANGSPVGTAQTGTGAALNFSPPTPAVGTTTYSVEATRTACAVATLGSADVTRVADPANGTLSTSATTLCVGTSLDLSFAGATVGATYILQRDGADLAGPTVAAGTTVAFNGISQSAGTANYQVMQVLTGCPITLASNVVYVAAVASPLATFGLTANRNQLCPGEVLSLSLSGSETGVAYQLLANGNPVGASQNGTGAALTFSPTPVAGATTYSVRATRTGCPPITMGNAVVNATLTLPTPGFFVTPSPAELGAPATITPTIGGPAPDAVTYLIEPGSTLLTAVPPTAPVQHVFSTDGTFTITQTVQIGNCTATLSLPLQVISGLLLIIPNAFSPNNDGLNDRVEFALTAVQRFSFQVFNRWGEKVFETNNPVSFWDGRLNGQDLPEGAYVYRLEVVDLAGRTQNRSGSIMLVR
jgi:gliding motility-associated-like protein